jgi:hypothetical protein
MGTSPATGRWYVTISVRTGSMKVRTITSIATA